MKKAIFLDRDGTLNIEKEYLYQEKYLELEKGTIEALQIFKDLGYVLLVVTNQSGIARGYYTEEDLKIFHEAFQKKLMKFGQKIDKFYYCPHHPEKGIGKYKKDCICRKPNIGMIEEGLKEFGIARELSYMVGDTKTDVQAALRAGLSPVLVRTGYGRMEEDKVLDISEKEVEIFDNLLSFAKHLKQKERSK